MQLRNTLLCFVVNGTELDGAFEGICGKALGKNSNHRILITRTRKPLAELLQVRKVRARHQKLQQRPQLRQVVLERSARQQQPPERAEHQEGIPPLRLEVLDHVRLVKDHVVPSLALEDVRVARCKRIRRDAGVEVVLVVPSLAELLALLRVPVVAEHLEAGHELLKLHLPIQEHARRDDDQVWSPDAAVAREVGE